MIEVNEKQECIEIKECLTFEHSVKTIYDEFVDQARDDLENPQSDMDDDKLNREHIKRLENFINHELTHEEKIDILRELTDLYERNWEYNDTVTIFDADVIEEAVREWISYTFDLDFL